MRPVALPFFVALISGAAGLALAAHHPVAPLAMTCMVVAYWVIFLTVPQWWLLVLPAMLPIIGFAPWTGWITFEELDILILAIGSGGYTHMAWQRRNSNPADTSPPYRQGRGVLLSLLLALFALSTTIAMFRGFGDAGGLRLGWFQGYHEALNSARLAKSIFAALLLLPLWHMRYKQDPEQAQKLLSAGLMLGLAAVCLITLWERLTFTGLLDFSADYRTTGPFWEMHVGGAALDGFLALTVPFAVQAMLISRTPARWGMAAGVCVLAGYTSLTTFSRGVYLAVPVGLAVLFVLQSLQRNQTVKAVPAKQSHAGRSYGLIVGVLLVAAYVVIAEGMFHSSGYRGAGSILGLMVLLLPLAGWLRPLRLNQWIAGGVGGLMLAAIAVTIAWLVPKGAYAVYGAGFFFTAVMIWAQQKRPFSTTVTGPLALSGFMATAMASVLVAKHWGYAVAVMPAAVGALGGLLLAVVAGSMRQPLWPVAVRWQAGVVCVMGMALAIIGVFGGGAYMGDRFAMTANHLDYRLTHWKLGIDMLRTPGDWWLGKGLGRFPANHFLAGNPKEHPGDYRLMHVGNDSHLKLTGGLHMLGEGELFRVTQRISAPAGPAKVTALVRTAMNIRLRFEACEKHLLYSANCMGRNVSVKAAPGKWQSIDVALEGGLRPGSWYAPMPIAFSIALTTPGSTVELDELGLSGPDGRNLLVNGDFANGMAHWFFSSDKLHMPWHMKNMFLHVLFDQGIFGLVLWSMLFAVAVMRLTVGRARSHSMAPAFAAGLAGFAIVGLFDSLLDVPRLATLFYFMLAVSLTLQNRLPQVRHEPMPSNRQPGRFTNRPAHKSSRATILVRIARALRVVLLAAMLGVGAVWLAAIAAGRSLMEVARTTPAEWVRIVKPWVIEHDSLAVVLLPALERLQSAIERRPPSEPLPMLGKGQQRVSLPPQRFAETGEPIPLDTSTTRVDQSKPEWRVTTAKELTQAIKDARAGQVIAVAPGQYRINYPVATGQAGTAMQPITMRTTNPGEALIELDTVEGFHITQPYWIIENLSIRGVCQIDSRCEHAIHVVGRARGVVIRNNRLEDFNAHIKVNGSAGHWPDHGLVQFNTLTNQRPRKTSAPVTPFDLVGASGWQVADNVITNFVKANGNQVSYGVFMKGAGAKGRIERNLIVCTPSQISQPGNRVGLSWGGGGSDAKSCRDKTCAMEHANGLAANNVIAHCNDAGVDVNHSQQITIMHNTLINTAGVLVRGKSEDVDLYGNLIEGRIRLDDAVAVTQAMNTMTALSMILVDPDRLQLDRNASMPFDTPLHPQVTTDFCNRPRPASTWAGAIGHPVAACTTP